MIIKREIEPAVVEGAKYFPVTAILGPRQSGKTTLAKMIFKDHKYVNLEDLDLREAAIKDPRTFLMAHKNKHGIILDEFQYVPQLLSYIQTIADEDPKPGYFILTGSQNFLMNESIAQSLSGRVAIHTLLPLSVGELESNNLLPDEIEQMLYKGCYPAIYSKSVAPEILYKNYVQTYVERDVRMLTQVGDLTTFQTFITLCAARQGQILNISSLGNDCGITDNTAKRWLSILEASYIIFILRPYHKNFGKRLIKSPKIFFYDSGLASYLLRLKESEVAFSPHKGGLFESFVISDFIKWHYNRDKIPNIYFWRDKAGREVDAVIEEGLTVTPVEIKSGRTTSGSFFDNLKYWNSLAGKPEGDGYVVFAGAKKQLRGYSNLVSWQSMGKIFG